MDKRHKNSSKNLAGFGKLIPLIPYDIILTGMQRG